MDLVRIIRDGMKHVVWISIACAESDLCSEMDNVCLLFLSFPLSLAPHFCFLGRGGYPR